MLNKKTLQVSPKTGTNGKHNPTTQFYKETASQWETERGREKGDAGKHHTPRRGLKAGEDSTCSKQKEATRLLPVLMCVVGRLQVRD